MIRKLNFNKAKLFDIPDLVVFIKPLGSSLHRVFKLPDLPDEKSNELEQVLNTICTAKRNGVWYFDFRDKETEKITSDTLMLMDIDPIMVCLDSSPELSN